MEGRGAYWPYPSRLGVLWRAYSLLQMGSVATASKLLLKTCTVTTSGLDTLYRHIEGSRPLLTVCNHKSCCDDPVMWGLLRTRHIWSLRWMRWSLAAHDIVFTNRVVATLCALGQAIPVVRGAGVQQRGIEYAAEQLGRGRWVNVYAEGRVNADTPELLPLKWGVGQIVAMASQAPIFLPIIHKGFERMLPPGYLVPRPFQSLEVHVGSPVDLAPVLQALRERGASSEEIRREITDLIEAHLTALNDTMHGRKATVPARARQRAEAIRGGAPATPLNEADVMGPGLAA